MTEEVDTSPTLQQPEIKRIQGIVGTNGRPNTIGSTRSYCNSTSSRNKSNSKRSATTSRLLCNTTKCNFTVSCKQYDFMYTQ
eukprot:1772114-Ditylum_brightwellii.AAC.1